MNAGSRETDRQSIDAIFCAAIERETANQRNDYLEEACQGDAELRRQVDRLLRAHFGAGSFLKSAGPAVEATVTQPVPESPGTVVGPYRLLEQIGEGGFGVVFMAEQTAPVKRKVALKVIKPGMDTRQVIARFEAERQALALMDHPNIARILDAGTTDGVRNAEFGVRNENEPSPPGIPYSEFRVPNSSGRPYFVMELVKGIPITEYCDQHRLTTRDRLAL